MPEDLLATAIADQPATANRPEDVPEKFWDSEAGQLRVDALLKSYRELERRLSQRLAPPAADAPAEEVMRFRRGLGIPDSPDEYQITPKHDLCCADDEVNQRLHEAGFTPAQAQLVYDLAAERLLPMIAEAAAQLEADRQVEKLREHFGRRAEGAGKPARGGGDIDFSDRLRAKTAQSFQEQQCIRRIGAALHLREGAAIAQHGFAPIQQKRRDIATPAQNGNAARNQRCQQFCLQAPVSGAQKA